MLVLRKVAIVALVGAASLACSVLVAAQPARPPGPAMMVHFDYYPRDMAQIHALEQRLARAIRKAGAGELGETEFHVDGNDGYLYMFGPDADRLYRVTAPILTSSRLMGGAEVTEWLAARTETFSLRAARKR